MANSEATFTLGVVYPDPADVSAVPALIRPHALVTRVLYTHQNAGTALVANGTLTAQNVSVDVGDIATEIVGYMLHNDTGQELSVSFDGGTTVAFALLDGETVMHAAPAGGAGTPITTITLVTTATQTGDRVVYFRVFGDPE